jgi:hypothetical protein
MSVILRDGAIHLAGACRLEDAEPFAALLIADRNRAVVMADCTQLHTAVLQVLLTFKPTILVPPQDSLVYGLLQCSRGSIWRPARHSPDAEP